MSLLKTVKAVIAPTAVNVLDYMLEEWKTTPEAQEKLVPTLDWFKEIWDRAVPDRAKTEEGAQAFAAYVKSVLPDFQDTYYLPQKLALMKALTTELRAQFNAKADTAAFPHFVTKTQITKNYRLYDTNGRYALSTKQWTDSTMKSNSSFVTPAMRDAVENGLQPMTDLEATILLGDADGQYEKVRIESSPIVSVLKLALQDKREMKFVVCTGVNLRDWNENARFIKTPRGAFTKAADTMPSFLDNLNIWPLSFAEFTLSPEGKLTPDDRHENALTDFPFYMSGAAKRQPTPV